MACQSNMDCNIGRKCMKEANKYGPGICVGGMDPGRPQPQRGLRMPSFQMPTLTLPGQQSKRGEQCSFNTDCDIGRQCVKTGGIYGVCN